MTWTVNSTKTQWLSALLAVTIFLPREDTRSKDQHRQQPDSALTVNDLSDEPGGHPGKIQLLGVVAAVSPGQGFILVDKREYASCGLTCLTERGTRKIPIRWGGNAPKLEQTVRVMGIFSESLQGLSFVAQSIGVQ
jgi:hypothetical protein